jgi:hypothetical protein
MRFNAPCVAAENATARLNGLSPRRRIRGRGFELMKTPPAAASPVSDRRSNGVDLGISLTLTAPMQRRSFQTARGCFARAARRNGG